MVRVAVISCFFLLLPSIGNGSDSIDSSYFPKSQNTYGGVGLIVTPTARFSDDGELTFGISSEVPYNRLYAKSQFFPWLEAVVKYTSATWASYNDSGVQTWKDKGIDVKVRLMQEGDILPALALGFNDIGGTGFYAGEYIVASKRFNNIDLTLGLGWGRLGGMGHNSINFDNPVGWISKKHKNRSGWGGYGGQFNIGRFFSGESVSLFGGVEYYTPIPNLSVKLEYDSSTYSDVQCAECTEGVFLQYDKSGDRFVLDTRFNLGLQYRLNIGEREKVDLSLGIVRGNTFFANAAIHSNLNFSGKPKIIMGAEELKKPYLKPYSKLSPEWKKYLADLIMWQMAGHGFITHSIIFNGNELQAEISQGFYKDQIQAIDLASRLLANNSPTNIEKITVINIDQGIETLRSTVSRESLVSAVRKGALDEKLVEFNVIEPLNPEAITVDNEYLYPHFGFSIKPHATGTLQHQTRFYFYQIEALLHFEAAFIKGLYVMADYGINIANNYDTYTWHIPDGQLHHVRQDRRRYLTEGESGMRRFAVDYLFDLHPNVKGKITAGLLEWMYGGYGGELVYMPDNKRWALGVDAYWVKQRGFDQKFSFQEYETVTGFVSYYQELPIFNSRLRISVGKFLGKDTGAIIDFSRRFKTGARVGAIVAITNCDPSCVGEGSFNKWIYFQLPMDLYFGKKSTRAKSVFGWSPLTKDAGTRVEPGNLYDLMVDAKDTVDSLRIEPWTRDDDKLIKRILSFGKESSTEDEVDFLQKEPISTKVPISLKKVFSGLSTKPKKRI